MRTPPKRDGLALLLWRRRLWLVPGLLLAVLAAVASTHHVQLSPFSLERKSAEFASATTQVLVDFPVQSSLLDTYRPIGPLAERALVFARLAATEDLLAEISRETGIAPTQIDARGPYNPDAQRIQREPTAERRSAQLRAEKRPYRLRFDSEQTESVPIVLLYAQAPTVGEAERLADGGATALITYLRRVQRAQGLEDDERLQLTRLGRAGGVVVNPGVDRQIALLVFLAAFASWSVLLLLVSNLRRFLASRTPVATAGARSGLPVPAGHRHPEPVDLDSERLVAPLTRSGR